MCVCAVSSALRAARSDDVLRGLLAAVEGEMSLQSPRTGEPHATERTRVDEGSWGEGDNPYKMSGHG